MIERQCRQTASISNSRRSLQYDVVNPAVVAHTRTAKQFTHQ